MARNYPVWFMESNSHMYLDSSNRMVHDGHGHNLYRYADRKLIALSGNGSMDVQENGRIVDHTGNQIGFITDFALFTKEIRSSRNTSGAGTKPNQTTRNTTGSSRTTGTGSNRTTGSGGAWATGTGSTRTTGSGSTGTTGTGSSRATGTGSTRTTGSGSTGTTGSGSTGTTGTTKTEKKKSYAWLVILIFLGLFFYLSQNNSSNSPKETIYKSVDEAAIELRKTIHNFDDEITLKYKVSKKQNTIKEEAVNLYQKAVAHTGNPNEGDCLTTQCYVIGYGGEYAEDRNGYIATITLKLKQATTKAQEQQLQARIKSIIKELNLTGKSDYQKVRAIYKWICSHVTYDYAGLNENGNLLCGTAYSAAMKGTAVCAGYASLFYRLALSAGLKVRINTSISHAWNLVYMNGLYYHCDATWDAGKSESKFKYFLRGQWNFSDHYGNASTYINNPFADHLTFLDTNLPVSNTDYKP